MSQNVFLSFAHRDRTTMPSVVAALQKRGVLDSKEVVFVDDSSMPVGSDWRKNIRAAIHQADKVVLYWTDAAASSMSINYEAGMAAALDKEVIVVMHDTPRTPPPAAALDHCITVTLPPIAPTPHN